MGDRKEKEAGNHEQLLKYAEDVTALYKSLKADNARLHKANRELEESFYQTFLMGFDLISMSNEFVGGHCKRVAYFSRKFAERINLDEPAVTRVKLAALLHDIGLICLSQLTLKRIFKGTERDEDVLAIYRQHPIVEIRPFASIEKYKRITQIIRWHHENIDCSGFPDGLEGDEIPVESQIISLANDYDKYWLIAKKSADQEAVLTSMRVDVGVKYSPKLFSAFESLIAGVDIFQRAESMVLEDVRAGMILAEAIEVPNGPKLISSNTELTEDHLRRLRQFKQNIPIKLPIKVYM